MFGHRAQLFSRKRWWLISAQLSNKFGHCPTWIVYSNEMLLVQQLTTWAYTGHHLLLLKNSMILRFESCHSLTPVSSVTRVSACKLLLLQRMINAKGLYEESYNDTVGKLVSSDSSGPQFESNHWHISFLVPRLNRQKWRKRERVRST